MVEARKGFARQRSSDFWHGRFARTSRITLRARRRITGSLGIAIFLPEIRRIFASVITQPDSGLFRALSYFCSASSQIAMAVGLPRAAAGELLDQLAVVRRVEHLQIHFGIELAQAADFAVLARDERLAQRGQLDVKVVLWQVEVGREKACRLAGVIPLDSERARLVLPLDVVEGQYARQLGFRFVGEARRLRRFSLRWRSRFDCGERAQDFVA